MKLSDYIAELTKLLDELGDVRVVESTWGGGAGSVQNAREPRREEMKVKTKRESYEKICYNNEDERSGEVVVRI